MHWPPTIGHSNTFVVPVTERALVGLNDSVTVQVPGPGNEEQVPNAKRERRVDPRPGSEIDLRSLHRR